MNEKTLKILEYDRIIEMLKTQAGSEMARSIISELMPVFDVSERDEIVQRQRETTEAVSLIEAKGPLPIGAITDIHDMVSFATKGGTLTMAQLLAVLRTLKTSRDVVGFMKGEDIPKLPLIDSIIEVITVQKNLIDEIDRCIISEDEMADNASPKLRDVRRAIIRKGESLRSRMERIVSSSENKTILQDSIITMRNGRFVIPVKQEHKASVPGIVHDQSGSGATLFIEPQSIVQMNNELRELQLEEEAEIARILEHLSGMVSEHHMEIDNDQKLLVMLDVMMAKGKLSIAMEATRPEIDEEGRMELHSAAHPLIDREKVVPVDISIGEDYKVLVITGPNTGGKTVTLKTAGLLSLMAQAGLHIPASSGSRLPVYGSVYADIGDEQSIEQSLSTFSSHMSNISSIIEASDENSLVLLDELGAGTDPAEGAALAISILERLLEKGTVCMATTHYTELKKFALQTDGVENASMEFDVETLRPTYHLKIGLPGRSNAFEIATKLGIEDRITRRAAELIDLGDIAFEEVIGSLEEEQRSIEEKKAEAESIRRQAQIMSEKAEAAAEKKRKKAEEALDEARREARQIIREAKELSSDIRKELRSLEKLDDVARLNARSDDNRRKLAELEKKTRRSIVREENTAPVDPDALKIGDRVKVLTIGGNGEIIDLPDEKGNLQVQVGRMKITAHIDDIMLIDTKPRSKGGATRQGTLKMRKAKTVSTSVDVRGKNLDDALMDVEKYIDDAFLSGLAEVTIIHGRGGNILSNGIRKRLGEMKNVKEYHRGAYNEGGDGVTIVKLKL